VPDTRNKSQGHEQYNIYLTNCIRPDGNCSVCSAYDEDSDDCNQDEDLGGTGHGDESHSDADPDL